MNSIFLSGTAGQGIKLLGNVLANILKDNNYNLTLISEYDAFVRSGKSSSYLIFSKEKIENPIIDDFDLTYNLEKLQNDLLKINDNKKTINMVMLGKILKKLNLKMPENIEEYLPKKYLKENLQAIKSGFE